MTKNNDSNGENKVDNGLIFADSPDGIPSALFTMILACATMRFSGLIVNQPDVATTMLSGKHPPATVNLNIANQ